MTKLTRYNLGEIYRTYSSDKHNVLCTAYDVEKLEAKCAELLDACESALTAMKNNDWNEHDSVFIGLRAAIAKAKGETL